MKRSPAVDDVATNKLVEVNTQNNLVALDKTLFAIRLATVGNRAQSVARLSLVSERITRAAYEVHFCVHPDKEFKP